MATYSDRSFELALEDAIRVAIEDVAADMVDKHMEQVRIQLQDRLAQIVMSVLTSYDVQRIENRIVIKVQMPEPNQ